MFSTVIVALATPNRIVVTIMFNVKGSLYQPKATLRD
jgi:hypothetical protein